MTRKTTWREDWRKRGRSGSAAVEFAILLPVFLAILFGIIQFGSVMFLHNNMVNAAREAVRRMSVAELNTTEAETYARNYLAGWNLTFNVNATEPPTTTDVSMTISVPAADAALINFPITWPGNLVAQASMRPEG
ncbi:TadE/TadG family type IV pilus assembly protein [Pelagibius marinus]|uniref:TadE/TadG family type IV pilus assembly protein n=1 Tax=Pelagibius marinus TaxID=2762760 RepID=UPI00187243C0|nr:TadE family protein [Pelagibius marinus]